ncbi:MAG: four helix bundle protein [Candidatus Cloacimonetes bacterium]|nr:four helix bundle protein [Candidatus Cloacimonadota bacterium]MBL7108156.1 four helix bundle protein [Candidatus Cloacimonadota bacterium]
MSKNLKKKFSISKELRERTYKFALRSFELCSKLRNNDEARIIKRQLLKAGSSVGANLEEADGSLTLNDFVYRVDISFKECKEARYWLRLIADRKLLQIELTQPLTDESLELIKILSTIIYKCLKN